MDPMVQELDDFLRDIPSPPINLFEILSQSLDQPTSAPDLPPILQPIYDKFLNENPKPKETKKRIRPPRKRSKKTATATGEKLVLTFNPNDLLDYFARSTKPDRQQIDQIDQIPDDPSPLKNTSTGELQPDLETANSRLSKENEDLTEEILLIRSRNLDLSDEIAHLRSLIRDDSKLAPFLFSFSTTSQMTTQIRIPISAIASTGQNVSHRKPKKRHLETSVSTITSVEDKGDGVCLHVVDDAVYIQYCENCCRSAQKRAQGNEMIGK